MAKQPDVITLKQVDKEGSMYVHLTKRKYMKKFPYRMIRIKKDAEGKVIDFEIKDIAKFTFSKWQIAAENMLLGVEYIAQDEFLKVWKEYEKQGTETTTGTKETT